MKVLITGSSGLIGSALAKSLTSNGHDVIRLLRHSFANDSPVWDPENGVMDLADVCGSTQLYIWPVKTLLMVVGTEVRKTASITAASEGQSSWQSILLTLIRSRR